MLQPSLPCPPAPAAGKNSAYAGTGRENMARLERFFALAIETDAACLYFSVSSRSSRKSSSDRMGIPSSFAFLFLDELDSVSLLIR